MIGGFRVRTERLTRLLPNGSQFASAANQHSYRLVTGAWGRWTIALASNPGHVELVWDPGDGTSDAFATTTPDQIVNSELTYSLGLGFDSLTSAASLELKAPLPWILIPPQSRIIWDYVDWVSPDLITVPRVQWIEIPQWMADAD